MNLMDFKIKVPFHILSYIKELLRIHIFEYF